MAGKPNLAALEVVCMGLACLRQEHCVARRLHYNSATYQMHDEFTASMNGMAEHELDG